VIINLRAYSFIDSPFLTLLSRRKKKEKKEKKAFFGKGEGVGNDRCDIK
jgi:hypothetical protein